MPVIVERRLLPEHVVVKIGRIYYANNGNGRVYWSDREPSKENAARGIVW
jgi:hypothetical protein